MSLIMSIHLQDWSITVLSLSCSASNHNNYNSTVWLHTRSRIFVSCGLVIATGFVLCIYYMVIFKAVTKEQKWKRHTCTEDLVLEELKETFRNWTQQTNLVPADKWKKRSDIFLEWVKEDLWVNGAHVEGHKKRQQTKVQVMSGEAQRTRWRQGNFRGRGNVWKQDFRDLEKCKCKML